MRKRVPRASQNRFGHYSSTLSIENDLTDDTRYRVVALESAYLHFAKLNQKLMLTAYALDPTNRCLYLTKRALRHVVEMALTILYYMGNQNSIAPAVVNEFNRYKYFLKREEQFDDNIFSWWNQRDTPLLKTVALRLAACHASSANTERIFSCLNRIAAPSRSRLNLQTIFDIASIQVHKLSERPVNRRTSGSQAQFQSQQTIEADEYSNTITLDETESNAHMKGSSIRITGSRAPQGI